MIHLWNIGTNVILSLCKLKIQSLTVNQISTNQVPCPQNQNIMLCDYFSVDFSTVITISLCTSAVPALMVNKLVTNQLPQTCTSSENILDHTNRGANKIWFKLNTFTAVLFRYGLWLPPWMTLCQRMNVKGRVTHQPLHHVKIAWFIPNRWFQFHDDWDRDSHIRS